MKQKTYPQLKKELDHVFSKFIRLRDRGLPYISCGKQKSLDCGHYYSRNHYAIRWDPDNCAGQCRYCNAYLQGNAQGFRKGLLERIGPDALDWLDSKAHITVKRTRQDLIVLIEYYKKKVAEYENQD